MTAEVVAFPDPSWPGEHEALTRALIELHALITIDPLLGASPVRVYFLVNPQAKRRIEAYIDPPDRAGAGRLAAYALVSFDFPYALHMFETGGSPLSQERAKEVILCSADLQEGSLSRAASAIGLDARLLATFDADALKLAFFPNTQETVINLFRLTLTSP